MARKQTVILLHTSGTTAPEAANLHFGELAVQHNAEEAALFTKQSDSKVAKFIDEDAVSGMVKASSDALIEIISEGDEAILDIIGSGFTSADTVEDAIKAEEDRAIGAEGTITTNLGTLSGSVESHTANTTIHVTAEDKGNWNAAEQNAKNYADGLKTAIDAYKVNDIAISTNPVLNGANVNVSSAYAKASTPAAVAANDTIDIALGKLEKQIDNAVAGGLQEVEAGDGINVTAVANNKQTISAKVDTTADNGVELTLEPAKGIGVKVEAIEDGTGITSTETKVVAAKAVAQYVESELSALTLTDAAVAGQYVSEIDQTDGKISVTRKYFDADDIQLSAVTSDESEFASEYALVNKNGVVLGAKIQIAKDQFLKSADFYKRAEDVPTGKQDYGTTEFPAIRFEWELAKSGSSVSWVSVKDLVDTYSASNGIVLNGSNFQGVVDSTSETFFTVGANGFKLAGVQDAINAAEASAETFATNSINALNATAGTQTVASGKHVAVEVIEASGKVTSVNVVEADIASASALTAEETRAKNAEDAISGQVSAFSASVVTNYVNKSGDTMTGDLKVGDHITLDADTGYINVGESIILAADSGDIGCNNITASGNIGAPILNVSGNAELKVVNVSSILDVAGGWSAITANGGEVTLQDALDAKADKANVEKSGSDAANFVTVTVAQSAGALSGVAVTVNNIAKADELSALSAGTIAADKTISGLVITEVTRATGVEEGLADDIEALSGVVSGLAAGTVISIGGKSGVITLDGDNTEAGKINLAMNDQELTASIVGIADFSGAVATLSASVVTNYATSAATVAADVVVSGLVATEETRAKNAEDAISGQVSAFSASVISNYVTKDGDEEIEGYKTFVSGIEVQDTLSADNANVVGLTVSKIYIPAFSEIEDDGKITLQDALDAKADKANVEKSGSDAANFVTVTVAQSAGALSGVAVTVNNIAKADELSALSAGTIAADKTISGLVATEETRAKGVEAELSGSISAITENYVKKTGDTMTGDYTINGGLTISYGGAEVHIIDGGIGAAGDVTTSGDFYASGGLFVGNGTEDDDWNLIYNLSLSQGLQTALDAKADATGLTALSATTVVIASDLDTLSAATVAIESAYVDDVVISNLSGVTKSKANKVITFDCTDMVIDCGTY